MENLKEQYKKYLDKEYKDAQRAIDNPYLSKKEVINNTIDRCLGVALFVQYLGLSYDDSDYFYEITRTKLEELRDA